MITQLSGFLQKSLGTVRCGEKECVPTLSNLASKDNLYVKPNLEQKYPVSCSSKNHTFLLGFEHLITSFYDAPLKLFNKLFANYAVSYDSQQVLYSHTIINSASLTHPFLSTWELDPQRPEISHNLQRNFANSSSSVTHIANS